MTEGAGPPDTRAVVAPVIRDLAARRLARSYFALVLLGLVALADVAVRADLRTAALLTLIGTAVSALALLARGMATVRRVFEGGPGPWGVGSAVGSVVVWGFAIWLLGFRGLRGLATLEGGVIGVTFAVAYVVFGIRLLRDMIRVGDVARLARVMIMPSPGEAKG